MIFFYHSFFNNGFNLKCYLKDLKDALRYYNPEQPFVPEIINSKLNELAFDYKTDEEHKKITDNIIDSLKKYKTEDLF